MKNWPLWSLSYEWWFYMLYFPVQRFLRHAPERQKHLALAISLTGFSTNLVWPNPLSHVASYFVIWWFGVELARSYLKDGTVTFSRMRFPLAALSTLGLLAGLLTLLAWSRGELDWYRHPAITLRHFVTTLGIIAIGGLWYRTGLWGFDKLLRPFAVVAPFSYALYVLHLPLIGALSHFGIHGTWGLPLVLPLIFGVCWLVEGPGQRLVNRCLRGLA